MEIPKLHGFKIKLTPHETTVEMDGQKIKGVFGVAVEKGKREMPFVTLTIATRDIELDGEGLAMKEVD